MPEQAERIAFVVEGDADKAVVESLAKRIWQTPPERVHTVRLGGRAAVPWLWATVLTLLDEKHYNHVVVLLDADTADGEKAADRVEELKAELLKHRITDDSVSIFLAVPELEAWLLAATEENPEVPGAKQRLRAALPEATSPDELARLASKLNLREARRRSPSLNTFLSALESLHR
ncbi:MAG TPA: DUF4276 family protein [Polyangiaceae bacterium]|nr:DUF4276 family protein [Polyangiaceae bacterium]